MSISFYGFLPALCFSHNHLFTDYERKHIDIYLAHSRSRIRFLNQPHDRGLEETRPSGPKRRARHNALLWDGDTNKSPWLIPLCGKLPLSVCHAVKSNSVCFPKSLPVKTIWQGGVGCNLQELLEIYLAHSGLLRALESMATHCRMLLICNLLKHIFVNHKHTNYICSCKAIKSIIYFTIRFKNGNYRN